MRAFTAVLAVALLLPAKQQEASAGREPFDGGWRFIRAESPAAPPKATGVEQGQGQAPAACKNITLMPGLVTMHLKPVPGVASLAACQQACCSVPSCETAQWCGPAGCGKDSAGKPSDQNTCWTGLLTNTRPSAGWQSYDMGRGHSPAPSPGPHPHPSPPPTPPSHPADPAFAHLEFDDSAWEAVDTPHDWMIHDLPSREQDTETPVLGPRYGTWRFKPWSAADGSDTTWSDPSFDDSGWQAVKGGQDCLELHR